MSLRLLLSATLLLALAACQPEPPQPSLFTRADIAGPATLHQDGFDFPARIGDFQRVATWDFDKADDDFSVGYRRGRMLAMIVVYPAHQQQLAREFASCREALERRHPGAQRLDEGSQPLGALGVVARRASYHYSESAGDQQADWRADLLLTRWGEQFVELRLSWPADALTGPAAASQFEQDFVWPATAPAA